MWSDRPPTYQEVRKAKCNGWWWVRIRVASFSEDGITWPEFNLTEAVQICFLHKDEYGKRYPLLGPCPLVAEGSIVGRLRLDDEKKTADLQWQPVKPPEEDPNDRTQDTHSC